MKGLSLILFLSILSLSSCTEEIYASGAEISDSVSNFSTDDSSDSEFDQDEARGVEYQEFPQKDEIWEIEWVNKLFGRTHLIAGKSTSRVFWDQPTKMAVPGMGGKKYPTIKRRYIRHDYHMWTSLKFFPSERAECCDPKTCAISVEHQDDYPFEGGFRHTDGRYFVTCDRKKKVKPEDREHDGAMIMSNFCKFFSEFHKKLPTYVVMTTDEDKVPTEFEYIWCKQKYNAEIDCKRKMTETLRVSYSTHNFKSSYTDVLKKDGFPTKCQDPEE